MRHSVVSRQLNTPFIFVKPSPMPQRGSPSETRKGRHSWRITPIVANRKSENWVDSRENQGNALGVLIRTPLISGEVTKLATLSAISGKESSIIALNSH